MKIVNQSVSLEWITPNAELVIESAGRTAYKSEGLIAPGSAARLIAKLLKGKHASVIEHASAGFRLITDRGISHEICRHRLASITQESTRYVNYTKSNHGGGDIQFVLPLGLTKTQTEFFLQKYEADQKFYNDAINIHKLTPQQARDGLPTGIKTELVMTCNFREWLHIIELRTDPTAHPKAIQLISGVRDFLQADSPNIFRGKP